MAETGTGTGSGISLGDASAALGAIGAAFGLVGGISQITSANRALERANKEAALAVAQARDKISKIPMLEKGIPAIATEQIQKDALRQRKQLLDAVRGSGQRSVLGAVPTIGEQILKEKETQRGAIEKQLQSREDEIVKAKQAQQDTELEMLTAAGTAAQQRAASAAQQKAAAVGSAISSAGSLAGSIMEGSELFGAEKRQFNRAVDSQLKDLPVDKNEFINYLNQRDESIEDLTGMLNDSGEALINDFYEQQSGLAADEDKFSELDEFSLQMEKI